MLQLLHGPNGWRRVIRWFFNGMPIVVLRVVRLTPTINVSETVRSLASSDPGWMIY